MILWLVACSNPLPALVQPGVPTDCAALVAGVEAERPIADVTQLAREPRRTVERRAEVRGWLRARLEPLGFVVEDRPFTLAGVAGVNVVAHGAAPGRILVGAHYDSVGATPGADDNASGVAVVLEAARVLGPDVGVSWVFFDAEEPHDASVPGDGRNFAFGSQAFVDATPGAWDLAVILESVGYGCDGCQQFPGGVPKAFPRDGRGLYHVVNRSERDWAGDLATWQAASRGHRAYAVSIPGAGRGLRQSRFSDHAAFWDAGVDAVMITDTALLRNPHYHRATDTVDRLDPALLADAARGTVALVGSAAGACGAP